MKREGRLQINWRRIWYMLCFFALGIIDQRRGSAPGNVQMTAANLTGVAIAAMLVPSLQLKRFRHVIYGIWTIIAAIGGNVACTWGWEHYLYRGQWVSAVLVIAVWGYLILYILHLCVSGEEESQILRRKVRKPFFWCVEAMLLFMLFSVHEGYMPLMLLVLAGGFYLIGIPKAAQEDFFQGMLNGIICWFFVQQIIAFGFRPYDYVRYRGLYSGETQNGLFYMIVYCAFLVKWLWLKESGRHRVWSWIHFFLAAGCVSFTLFTGGRSPLVGIALATVVVLIWYDIVWRKSFYRLLLHGVLGLACVVVTFPVVYGCIRYLPTVLHHPVWFEGEYNGNNVMYNDPWDSPKYISFETAVDINIGRILQVIGIDIRKWTSEIPGSAWVMRVHAQEPGELEESGEQGEPGDTQENPFTLPDTERGNSVDVRKVIHVYCIQHLNWRGHAKRAGFYIFDGLLIDHAHNMFLEIGYNHGIPAGLLFVGIYCYSLIWSFRKRRLEGMLCVTFLLAILGYGMFEMAVVTGQITVSLMGILFCLAGEEGEEPETAMGSRQKEEAAVTEICEIESSVGENTSAGV